MRQSDDIIEVGAPRVPGAAAARIDGFLAMFADKGGQHYGEDTSQLSHALQCAALAIEDGCGEPLIAAALLHDIGQLIDDAGSAAEVHGIDATHEEQGARLLATVFPASVTEPVRLHVAAKRYLCAVEPAYATGLSAASRLSLRLQGGPMAVREIETFERHPHFADAVVLRRFDDMGKRRDWSVPTLDSYRPLLLRVAQQ